MDYGVGRHGRRPVAARLMFVSLFGLDCTALGVIIGMEADGVYRISLYLPKGGFTHEGSYTVGWVELGDGRKIHFREEPLSYETNDHNAKLWRAAAIAKRARQQTDYYFYRRGFPFCWLEYHEASTPPHGLHIDVRPDQLESYERFRLQRIAIHALVLDCALFSLVGIGMIEARALLTVWLRRRQRRCVICSYDIRTVSNAKCPECGSALNPKEDVKASKG